MPRGDGTGPYGGGPRTGRGLGYCAGYERPGYESAPAHYWSAGYRWAPGGGYGYGARGAGRGHRSWYYRTGLTGWQRAQVDFAPRYGQPAFGWGWEPTKEQQIADLKAQAAYLENALSGVRKDLEDLAAAEED